MADNNQSPAQPVTARASFTLLAKLALTLLPKERGEAISAAATKLASDLGDMDLTPVHLADAYAALGSGHGQEDAATRQRRLDCVDLAERLAVSQGKTTIAGARPPHQNAIKAWALLAELGARGHAWREFVELSANAAIKVIGRGAAKVKGSRSDAVSGFLSTLPTDDKGSITITQVIVGDAVYALPVPITVQQQAALHRIAHPWALLGLRLGDVGHGHPTPPAG